MSILGVSVVRVAATRVQHDLGPGKSPDANERVIFALARVEFPLEMNEKTEKPRPYDFAGREVTAPRK